MTTLDFMKKVVNGVDGNIDLCLDKYEEIKRIPIEIEEHPIEWKSTALNSKAEIDISSTIEIK